MLAQTQPKLKKAYDPKEHYAIVEARYVTIWCGRRFTKKYHSGEKFVGRLVRREDSML